MVTKYTWSSDMGCSSNSTLEKAAEGVFEGGGAVTGKICSNRGVATGWPQNRYRLALRVLVIRVHPTFFDLVTPLSSNMQFLSF